MKFGLIDFTAKEFSLRLFKRFFSHFGHANAVFSRSCVDEKILSRFFSLIAIANRFFIVRGHEIWSGRAIGTSDPSDLIEFLAVRLADSSQEASLSVGQNAVVKSIRLAYSRRLETRIPAWRFL